MIEFLTLAGNAYVTIEDGEITLAVAPTDHGLHQVALTDKEATDLARQLLNAVSYN